MVDVVSRIKLLFVSQGAEKAAKQTEQVGRAQTRLGQASASTGRQFSAQASGLGGLVSAYAGAAATIFAVTMAFNALSKAAQAEQVIQGTKALALEVGASGNEIIKSIQKITKGQLSMAEAAASANIAFSAGFNTEQIERLTSVSLKASRALGRTLTDALTRLTRGTAKLEPELLDELGIFVRIEPAVEAYASQLGKVASSLTSFERRQAFVNATIEEGERKFGIINTTTETTLEGFEKLQATFQDLAREFGNLLADTLAPIARFFSDSLGNSLLLFLAVGRLVFGKAGQLMSGFFKNQLQNLDRWSDKMTAAVAKTTTFSDATAKVGGSAISAKGQFVGPKAQAAGASAARERARQGDVSLRQMMRDKKALTGVKEAERGYRRAVMASNRSTATKNKLLADSRSRSLFAATAINRYTKAVTGASFGNKAFAVSANVASMAIKGLSAAMSVLMSVVNVVFMVVGAAQLIGSLFDVDILGGIVDWFKKIGAEARAVRKGIEGVVSAVSMGDEIREMFRSEFTEEDFKEIGIIARKGIKRGLKGARMVDLNPATRNAATAPLFDDQTVQGTSRISTRGDDLGKATEAELQSLVDRTNEALGNLELRLSVVRELSAATSLRVIEKSSNAINVNTIQASSYVTLLRELDVAQAKLTKEQLLPVDDKDAATILKLRIEVAGLTVALEGIKSGAVVFGLLGVKLSELTGVPIGRLINNLNEANNTFISTGTELMYLGKTIATLNTETNLFTADKMFDAFTGLMGVESRFADLQNRVNDAWARGAIDAQGMSQKVGGLGALIKEYNKVLDFNSKEYENLKNKMDDANIPMQLQHIIIGEIMGRVQDLNKEYDELAGKSKKLAELENINKTMRKIFSAELKMFDDAAFKGVVNDAGEFAITQKDITANSKAFLSNQISGLNISQTTKDLMAEHGSSAEVLAYHTANKLDLDAEIRQELVNTETAMKALIGGTSKMVLEAEKLRVSIEKMSDKLKQAKSIIDMKENVAATKREITKLNADLARGNKILAESAKYRKVSLDMVKQQIAHGKQVLEIEKNRLETNKRTREVTGEINSANAALTQAQAKLGGERITGGTQRELAAMERNENLHTAEEIRQKQEELLKQELSQALRILRLQEQQAQREESARIATLNYQKDVQTAIITEQKNRLKLEFENTRSVQKLEAVNLTKKQNQEQNKAKNDISVLEKQEQLLQQEQTLAVQQVNNRAETAKTQAMKMVNEAKLLAEQARVYQEGSTALAEVFNGFLKGIQYFTGAKIELINVDKLNKVDNALGKIVIKAAELEKGAVGILMQLESNRKAEVTNLEAEFTAKEDARKADLIAARRGLKSIIERHKKEKELAVMVTEDAKKLLENKIAVAEAEITEIDRLIKNEETLAEIRRTEFESQREALIRNAELQQDILDRQRDSMLNFLNDLSGKLQGRFKEGIDSLFKAMNEGTLTMENFKEGFKDWLFNILGDIQQSLIDEFVTKPIQELIKSGMGSIKDLFRPESEKGAEVQSIQDLLIKQSNQELDIFERTKMFEQANVQQVFVVNMPGEGFTQRAIGGDKLGGNQRGDIEDNKNAQEDLSTATKQSTLDVKALGVTAIATFGSVYAATGDFKKSMIATFLAMFLQIAAQKAAAAIGSFFSSGGSVRKLAAGGSIQKFAAGGVMQRDRVPALLEPGEFVIRKPMAKAIGGPALGRMNATGQMPAGNVEVNMINKGTPQSAQVEQKPQIDGKGIVIEIVLNDLKNNGPIKQAMRGGGSR